MSDGIPLPSRVLSAYDESWEEVNDYLRNIGELSEDEIVKGYTISIDADDLVVVKDIDTEEVLENGS